MIEMTYGEAANQNFLGAMQKLAGMNLPVRTAYQIKKIADGITQQKRLISDAFQKDLLEPFAQKNEDGTIFKPEGGLEHFEWIKGKEEEAAKAQEAFSERKFILDRRKITISDLGHTQMTARDLMFLSAIVADEESETCDAPKGPQLVKA